MGCGGHLRGGGHGVFGSHCCNTCALTSGGLVVALHIADAGGVLVAVEGDGVGAARRRHVGGAAVVVPAALRGVRAVGGGEDNLTRAAAAVVLGGNRRKFRHRVHRDAHGHATALAAGGAVVARHIVGLIFGERRRVGVVRMERRLAVLVGVPAADRAVRAGGGRQRLVARTTQTLVGNGRQARRGTHRHGQRDGAVTTGNVLCVDGVSSGCVDGCA